MRRVALIGALALALSALGGAAPWPAVASIPTSCPGAAPTPTAVVSGTFGPAFEGATVMVPFEVPADATKVRARLCHDQPDLPTNAQIRHTLDLGLYEPRGGDGEWDTEEFRGWGGSSRRDVSVSPTGATAGFDPGPVPEGEWAAEIGVAAVAGMDEGDTDATVGWRLELIVTSDPADATPAWTPAPYSTAPANPNPGWYKGDMHVHAEHSGSAPTAAVLDYAFGARPAKAGLDFITLSDYVTDRHWDEIGAFQAAYPGKLVVRSAEVITYRGHVNNHASATHVDYRTGPVYRWNGAAPPTLLRPARPASAIFDAIHAGGGWTQVNHPTTFPSTVPPFSNLCRGCSWEYSDGETDWSRVDSMEVQTGPSGYTDPEGNEPGPNPFTPLAIEWWDRLRRAGHDITAVGSSDSHRAGADDLLYSPIGEATTVVYASELSEAGIRAGVLAGHAYVKFFSSDGPDLRFEARAIEVGGEGPPVMMGDELAAAAATMTARVSGAFPTAASPVPRTLLVLRDGVPFLASPVTSADFTVSFAATAPGDYRLQLQRGSAIEALSNPITLTLPPLP